MTYIPKFSYRPKTTGRRVRTLTYRLETWSMGKIVMQFPIADLKLLDQCVSMLEVYRSVEVFDGDNLLIEMRRYEEP